MNVKRLRELIRDLPEEAKVYIRATWDTDLPLKGEVIGKGREAEHTPYIVIR